MTTFAAIDFETANVTRTVVVPSDSWSWLLTPVEVIQTV
jgi:hypothetical protein